jgi:16S rRNA U516 pseudouridylate synthase RsuA-like enzyme
MVEAVGGRVRRLHRRVYAGLTLEGIEPGAWRELTREEVAALSDLVADSN